MERPRSFSAYNEDRESPDGGGFSDSGYNFLNEKLAEVRKAIGERSPARAEERLPVEIEQDILRKVSALYEGRSFNLGVQGKLAETLQKIEQIKEKKEIATQIVFARREAQLEKDEELQDFIERMYTEQHTYELEAGKLSHAVTANEESAAKKVSDPRIMAKMEEDASEENSKREGN